MSSAFERALTAGLALSRTVAGVSVTVTRGATSINLTAVQGQTQKLVIDETSEATVDAVDWLIPVAAYTLGNPAIGDIITRKINGTTYTYTVESLQMGQQPWDWSDTGKTQYRIRSRKDGGSAFEVVQPNGFDISGNEMRY